MNKYKEKQEWGGGDGMGLRCMEGILPTALQMILEHGSIPKSPAYRH